MWRLLTQLRQPSRSTYDQLFANIRSGREDLFLRQVNSYTSLDLNRQDRVGNTFLHYAALTGQVEAVKTLINAGVNWRSVNNGGRTPLDFAVLGDGRIQK